MNLQKQTKNVFFIKKRQLTIFIHMNAYGMLPVVIIIKTKTTLLALEEVDMSLQEYGINRYDYQKWTNL